MQKAAPFRTVLTLWGDWGKRTNQTADILTKAGIPFRVCLTHDYPGTVVLSAPFGDIVGLGRIRAFVASWVEQDERENLNVDDG